jgi:hypothetical protein
MKTLYTILLILIFSNIVSAKDVFTEKNSRDIRILEIRNGKAIAATGDKRRTEVEVGDAIGKEGGVVVEIEKNAIVIEQGNTRVRMRPFPGLVREENVPL